MPTLTRAKLHGVNAFVIVLDLMRTIFNED
jgi:hypothetical protein